MNQNETVSGLKKDILRLYASIGHKDLEKVFIKIAEVEVNAFARWLDREKKIKKKLSEPLVWDALNLLINLRSKFPQDSEIDFSTLVQIFVSDKRNLALVQTIFSFYSGLSDKNIREILEPFSDLITAIKTRFEYHEPINKNVVLGDLSLIRGEYFNADMEEDGSSSFKVSVLQQRKNMFQFLLMRFSEDIASAADASSLPKLAEEVRNGALARPYVYGLNKHINFNGVSTSIMNNSKKALEFVWKNYSPRNNEYNHNLIEITFMARAGQITQEQIMEIKRKFEESKTMGMLTDELDHPKMDTSMIKIDNRLNPKYLVMLSTFFVLYQAKLGMPTSVSL